MSKNKKHLFRYFLIFIKSINLGFFGGADGNRTRYLFVANESLSQMSYSPKTMIILKEESCFFNFFPIDLVFYFFKLIINFKVMLF